MKAMLKFLSVLAVISSLAGCAAQKTVHKPGVLSAESEIQHREALTALETGRFMIKAEEFYLQKKDLSVRSSNNSYISMQDDRAIMKYSPEIFLRTHLNFLNIEGAAKIKKVKTAKRGDVRFRMETTGTNPSYLNGVVIITLFHNTNKCFVQVGNGAGFSFTGSVFRL